MTTKPATDRTTNARLEMGIEFAKRSLADLTTDAKADIRKRMGQIRRALDEAERRLDAGDTPNTCGILQGQAFELEMALARLVAMRDANPAIEILEDAVETLRAEAGR